MSAQEKAKYISNCLQLAILLEVSAEKPGNVNLTSSFEGTMCQHFLASAVAAGSSFQEAANRGIAVTENRLSFSEVGLGQLIKTCVSDVNAWQRGGNTILGTIILFAPIAVAAGATPTDKNYVFDFSVLRKNIDLTVKSTSALDSVHLYEAVDIANPGGLNEARAEPVRGPRSGRPRRRRAPGRERGSRARARVIAACRHGNTPRGNVVVTNQGVADRDKGFG